MYFRNQQWLRKGTQAMQIAIIGAGHVGSALAGTLTKAGYRVAVANSRGKESLSDFTRRTGALACDMAGIAMGADILIIAIPLCHVPNLPASVLAHLAAHAVVVDANNYYPARDGRIAAIDAGQVESDWVANQFGRPVIKAFNNIIADHLAHRGGSAGIAGRIALPVSGDDPESRRTIMTIVDAIGFTPFDAGTIAESWRQQPGQPAYCTDPTIDELRDLLHRADRQAAIRNRDKSVRLMAKLPSDYPSDQLVRVARLFVGLDKWKPATWAALLRLGITVLRHRS
ncbi:NADPH-dependent F420 reductase [Acetobacter nitrogenifigens]|nr:NAD(P)-binding domain-containing protein [Acetobacter nitrogenifigens]